MGEEKQRSELYEAAKCFYQQLIITGLDALRDHDDARADRSLKLMRHMNTWWDGEAEGR